jgi:hypothetical protein
VRIAPGSVAARSSALDVTGDGQQQAQQDGDDQPAHGNLASLVDGLRFHGLRSSDLRAKGRSTAELPSIAKETGAAGGRHAELAGVDARESLGTGVAAR